MAWRVVKSLLVLRDQINAAHPGRAKGGDGTVGDQSHVLEGSTSDHNPHTYTALGPTPVVCALDITHDPAHGCDSYAIAEAVRASRDPRIGYIISNRRIASNHPVGGTPAWVWRTYTGTADPHTGHAHFSSVHDARADQTQPWAIGGAPPPPQGDDMPLTPQDLVAIWTHDLVDGPGVGMAYKLINQLVADTAAIKAALGVAQTGIDTIEAKAGTATFTDAQVTAIADRLIASGANGLTAADHAGVVADVKAALGTVKLTTG